MTHDEMIAVIAAHRDGKKIQCKSQRYTNAEWNNLPSGPSWEFHSNDYRVAPEPKLRPWKPEEVPVGAVTRTIFGHSDRCVIGAADKYGVYLFGDNGPYMYTHLKEHREYSSDGGKTWLPCGVMEGEG